MALFGKKAEHKLDQQVPEIDAAPFATAPARGRYGIDDAVQLMRTLPLNQNTELILLVIRNTLASINVDLKEVIDDGAAKQNRLRAKIAEVASVIAELEKEIAIRKGEVTALEADLMETTTVKERLEAAARKDEPIMLPNIVGSQRTASSARPAKPPPRTPSPAPIDPSLDIDPISEPSPTHGNTL